MSTKHVSRAVCAVRAREYSNLRKYRYPAQPTYGVLSGHSHVTLTSDSQMVEMTIDLAALIDWMGRRAMCAKSGKSVLQSGLIVARVIGARTKELVEERDIPLDPGAELVV